MKVRVIQERGEKEKGKGKQQEETQNHFRMIQYKKERRKNGRM